MKQRPDWTSLRILLVDRNIDFRFRLRAKLKRLGVAEILTTGDSLRVHGLVKRMAFDIAVVEIAEMGAMELLRYVRDEASGPNVTTPLLIMAEGDGDYQVAVARGLGIEGVLPRPGLGVDAVLAKIAEILLDPRRLGAAENESRKAAKAALTPPRARAVPKHVKSPSPVSGMAQPVIGPPPSGGSASLELIEVKADKASSEGIELADPPPEERRDAGFLEPAPASVKKAKKQDDGIETAAGNKKRRRPVEEVAEIEVIPPPPVEDKIDDLPEILAAHEQWVLSSAAQGQRANLEGRVFEGVSLENAVLADALLKGAELVGANLLGADLHGADLRRAELLGAVMTGCNLAVARLRHARMAGCRLEGASLKGADLAGADLAGAKLVDADLTGANLLSTDLTGADLSGVTGLTRAQVGAARTDAATVLPLGLAALAPEPDAQ